MLLIKVRLCVNRLREILENLPVGIEGFTYRHPVVLSQFVHPVQDTLQPDSAEEYLKGNEANQPQGVQSESNLVWYR